MSASSNVKLLLCFSNTSKLALSIPLVECKTFANTPLKWLRFLGFIIYGHPSTSMNSPEPDYTPEIEACSYYFISIGKLHSYTLRSFLILLSFSGEPRLADVDATDNRTSNASALSTGRAHFRQKLIERDGTCVLTGDRPLNCDAYHFLPHSKGDTVCAFFLDLTSIRNKLCLQSSTCQTSSITDMKHTISWTHWMTSTALEMGFY